MLTVNKLLSQGHGLSTVLLKRAAVVSLPWDLRRTPHFEATDSQGRVLGVDLPAGSVLRNGDVLVAEDGSLIRVEAAPQPVLVVTPCATHGRPHDLLRAAYQLGQRHAAVELQAHRLILAPDDALAALLRDLHLDVVQAEVPFEPEPVSATVRKPIAIPVAAAPHVHGPGCGHHH